MPISLEEEAQRYVLPAERFAQLLERLWATGYQVIAPVLHDGAMTPEPITSADALPKGYTDEQRAGVYRLKHRSDKALFAYAAAAYSWKGYLYPAQLCLWRAQRTDDGGFEVSAPPDEETRYAFVGVRPCDWAAIQILDKVLLCPPYPDEYYRRRREQALFVVVNCTHPAENCFCTSLGTGPVALPGADLTLTEVTSNRAHFFIVQVGSERGNALVEQLGLDTASEEEWRAAQQAVHSAVRRIGKHLDVADLRALLYNQLDSEHWEEVAKRCLTCANCTLVCPTCFCHRMEEHTDLLGESTERWRRWDSCFHIEFTYIHGSAVRVSGASRYRQWITHKLAAWQDQFDVIGCVGCGRCITWCPVGIDITEEVRALRRRVAGSSKEESHANA